MKVQQSENLRISCEVKQLQGKEKSLSTDLYYE
jgi:hypothetical protein